MDLAWETKDGVTMIRAAGKMDAGAVAQLRQTQCLQPEALNDTALDLSDVSFIDSAGLAAIVFVLKTLKDADKRLVLAAPNAVVAKALRVTALDKLLPIEPSAEEALAALKQS